MDWFREFAERCARAFDATIEMRDESLDVPIPEQFQPSSYHQDALKEAQKKLLEAKRISPAKAKRLAHEAYVKELESSRKYETKNRVLAVKYGDMLAEVAGWRSLKK